VTPGATTAVPPSNIAYDFATNACSATWFSLAGQLACPGTDGDAKGFVLKVSNPKLETGATDSRPGLITFPSPPQGVTDGYIQGFFPAFKVQSGDRFRSIINCEGNATICYVAFRLDYQTGTEPIKTLFGPFRERYEGQFYSVDVNLNALAGKDVKFILTVLSAGVNTGDRALWVGPIIYRAGASPATATTPIATTAVPTTPVATTAVPTTPTTPIATTAVPTTAVPTTQVATISATASTPAASAYQNTKYNFKFSLPPGASIVSQTDNVGRVSLPIIAGGTNLLEKYVQVNVEEN
jgi:hypothetical protein